MLRYRQSRRPTQFAKNAKRMGHGSFFGSLAQRRGSSGAGRGNLLFAGRLHSHRTTEYSESPFDVPVRMFANIGRMRSRRMPRPRQGTGGIIFGHRFGTRRSADSGCICGKVWGNSAGRATDDGLRPGSVDCAVCGVCRGVAGNHSAHPALGRAGEKSTDSGGGRGGRARFGGNEAGGTGTDGTYSP